MRSEPYAGRTSEKPAATSRSQRSSFQRWLALASRKPRLSSVSRDALDRRTLLVRCRSVRALTTSSRSEAGADVVELAQQRLVLRLEQLVRHVRRLEHRERVGAPRRPERDNAGGEQSHLVFARARVHVDDAGGGVCVDCEAELAQAVHDLGLAALVLELAGEFGRPNWQVVNVG